jgi:hypothetical protein
VSVGSTAFFTGIHGTSPTDIWIVGNASPNAVVVRFNGTTWTVMTNIGAVNVADVYTPVFDTAYVVGSGSTIMKYSGGTWTQMTPGADSWFRRILGRSATDIWVVGYPQGGSSNATIQHFDGNVWTVDSTRGTSNSFYDIAGTDTELYAVMYESNFSKMQIQRRTPSGWVDVAASPNGQYILGLAMTPSGELLAAGQLGVQRLDVWSRGYSAPVFPATFQDVWQASDTDSIQVGSGGIIWRRVGNLWTQMTSNTTNTLNGIWGSSASRIFAVGASGTILLWDGVGPGWTTMTTSPATTSTFWDVWGTGPNDVFAVGGNGTGGAIIYHYDGNASNIWTAMSFTGTNALYAVGGTGSNDVYAAGYGGFTLHYTGSWSSVSFGSVGALSPTNGIAGRRPGEVVLVGAGGGIRRTEDYGVTWHAMNSTTTNDLSGVAAVGPRGDVWAVGASGTLLHFDDERWTSVRPVIGLTSAKISALPNHLAVAGSGAGNYHGYELHHTKGTVERCGNEWDDDADGFHDCADPDCAGSSYCMAGGACQVAETITCGATVSGSSFTGSPFPDEYACTSTRLETGPEVAYRFTAPASGSVTVTLSGYAADVDLFVLKEQATGGCDPIACMGSSITSGATESVTFTAVGGQTYDLVVDGYSGAASNFTMAVSCP